MKKLVLVYGSIAGAIVALMLIISFAIMGAHEDGAAASNGELIGYSSQVLAMSMIFIAVHSYKKNYLGGSIGFWKAWKVGLLIALLASAIYVLTWFIMYKTTYSDFMDNYSTQMIQQAEESGKSPDEIAELKSQIEWYKKMYSTVVGFIALTLMEILPTGFIMSLIAAIVFSIGKKKKKEEQVTTS